jgi:hypothetical protein
MMKCVIPAGQPVSPVMCSGLLNTDNCNGVETSLLRSGLNLRLGMRDKYKVRIGT